ncbi:MAG: serine/threonine-protein kinase, partial [Planctomycetota bacterium]
MNDELHRRARAVFLEVTTVDDEAARDQVDRLAGGDLELRAAVLRMIEAQQRADDAAMMTAPTQRAAPARAHAHAFDRIVGTRIGPYKALQSIGEGGFGSVFLAEQTEPVRRRVALKIIKLGMDTKQVIARFEAERQALALMDHPHIASVFDAGTTDTGRPYFVMEYVVGDAITAFADAYKLSIAERLELFTQVCAAVQHAHTKGIIHRDLKPGNVLVSMVDGRPFAKVIDFGIAKATSSPLTTKTLFTEHRQLIGTPEYMSPEQAEGSPDIDTRTDVYALGVLLYELLTSETPFDGKRLRSAAYAEMQRIIREEEPPAPSMRLSRAVGSLASTAEARKAEPIKLSASIRGELDWIVMKALDKDRARRYATPAQFAGDLENHRRGEPVTAAPPRRMYRAVKLMKRNKGPVVAGGAIAAALLVGLAGTGWGWHATSRVNTELLRQQDRAEEGVGEMMGILMGRPVGPIAPGISADTGEPATTDPLEFAVGFGIQLAEQLRDERDALQEQTTAAQWSAYTANVALASQAIDADDFPAARRWLAECAEDLRGWEWQFLHARAHSVLSRHFGSRMGVSRNGDLIANVTGSTINLIDTEGNPAGDIVLPERAFVWAGLFSKDGSACAVWFDPDDSPAGDMNATRVVTVNGDPTQPTTDIAGRPIA